MLIMRKMLYDKGCNIDSSALGKVFYNGHVNNEVDSPLCVSPKKLGNIKFGSLDFHG